MFNDTRNRYKYVELVITKQNITFMNECMLDMSLYNLALSISLFLKRDVRLSRLLPKLLAKNRRAEYGPQTPCEYHSVDPSLTSTR